MQAQLLSALSLAAYLAAAIFLVLAVVLLFALKIPALLRRKASTQDVQNAAVAADEVMMIHTDEELIP